MEQDKYDYIKIRTRSFTRITHDANPIAMDGKGISAASRINNDDKPKDMDKDTRRTHTHTFRNVIVTY